jgi:tetratricopeptide (TPR) repeat protein
MSDVFISYSREDNSVLRELVLQLRAAGPQVSIFYDGNINAGDDWEAALDREIESCACLVALISPNAIGSKYFKHETERAAQIRKRVLPFLIRDIAIPDYLARPQMRPLDDEYRLRPLDQFESGRRATKLREFAGEIVEVVTSGVAISRAEYTCGKTSAAELAKEYVAAPPARRKEILGLLACEFMAITSVRSEIDAKELVAEFADTVGPHGPGTVIMSHGINLYGEIITLLLGGLPKTPHMPGLDRVRPLELVANPAYCVMLQAMKLMENDYRKALERLQSIRKDPLVATCGLYRCLLIQCYGKLGLSSDARHEAEAAVRDIEAWMRLGKSTCNCSNCRSTEGSTLLLMEACRALGSIHRVSGNIAAAEARFEQALSLFEKSRDSFNQADAAFDDLLKKGSDIYFSYGYFLFEKYFNDKVPPAALAAEVVARLARSCELDCRNSAPFGRIGIVKLALCDHEGADSAFYDATRRLHFGRETLNLEERFVEVWVALARAHLRAVAPEDHQLREIAEMSEAIFREHAVPPKPLRCHNFDLRVIDRIFASQGKPIVSSHLKAVIDDWQARVGRLPP